ncbi:MAG: transposase, partial [Calditrichaeota bacterium]|nr:transposase [Calditrichota bacterium]
VVLRKAAELGILFHAIGGVEDHVHVVASIPPRLAVAECVKHFKGSSARFVNQGNPEASFKWQKGYGVLTFGGRAMRDVITYVLNQKKHHREGATRWVFERITENDEGVRPATKAGNI